MMRLAAATPDRRGVFSPGAWRAVPVSYIMLSTGDTIDGCVAKAWGLVHDAVPATSLDAEVDRLAARIAGVPKNQLMTQKLMINRACDNMGLAGTQFIATLFDGIARHSPEGLWFKRYAEEHGFHQAVAWRDSGKPIPEGRDGK